MRAFFLILLGATAAITSSLSGESGEWWLSEAESALVAGECSKVEESLERAREQLPQDPRIPLFLGLCYLIEEKFAQAVQELSGVVTTFPHARIPYAFALLEIGEKEAALQSLSALGEMDETILPEILQALTLLQINPPEGIAALNQVIRKYKEFRGELLFFRALVQLRSQQHEAAQTALKASYQLKREDPEGTFIKRILTLSQGKGEANRRFYGDLYLDTVYQTNVTRVPEGDRKTRWFTGFLRGRGMFRTLTLPWYFSSLLWVDQGIPYPSPPEVTRARDTLVGAHLSLNYLLIRNYRAHDFGLGLEPILALVNGKPGVLDFYLRPSYTLAVSPERTYKFFYELGFHQGYRSQLPLPSLPGLQDLIEHRIDQDLSATQIHRVGFRPSFTWGNPRVYLSPYLSYRLQTASAPSLGFHGPEFGIQFSSLPFLGLIIQGGTNLGFALYNEPRHEDLTLSSWLGVGFFVEEWKILAMLGGGYESLISPILPFRNAWGFLRVGAYF